MRREENERPVGPGPRQPPPVPGRKILIPNGPWYQPTAAGPTVALTVGW
jgi:hypothetical protein